MFRPVSVELWWSDKNQVKSCFKPHSRCSPPISPCFNKVSWDKEVLWQEIGTQECIVALSVCVCVFFSSTKALHMCCQCKQRMRLLSLSYDLRCMPQGFRLGCIHPCIDAPPIQCCPYQLSQCYDIVHHVFLDLINIILCLLRVYILPRCLWCLCVYGVETITYLILVIIQLSMCLFFCIAATCQPCTTCLHIPLLYIPAYSI